MREQPRWPLAGVIGPATVKLLTLGKKRAWRVTLKAQTSAALLAAHPTGGGGGISALSGVREVTFEVETVSRVA